MGKNKRLTVSELKRAVGPDLERLLQETAEALNSARDGAIIADSEEVVRDAMARFRRLVYERAVQLKAAAGEAAFSPSEGCNRPPPP